MKKILLILCLLISVAASAQYNPTQHIVVSKALGFNLPNPADARTMFFDAVNFVYRPYNGTTEVLTYLNLPKYRFGNFIIIVDSGGTLQPNGTYIGGTNTFWMFKDGTADGNLIELNLLGSSGGGSGTLTNLTSTDGGGIHLAITNPTTTPNITPSVALGGDISGSSLSAVTVAKFNGQLPAFYLNYNNLVNTPTIPAQFNPIAGSGIALAGSYPNITFTATGIFFNTAGFGLKALSSSTVAIDSANIRIVDTLYNLNDSTLVYGIYSKLDTIILRGGTHGGGGGGGITQITGANVNGITWTITAPTGPTTNLSIALGNITPTTVNGLTFTALATGFTVQGGTASRTLTVPANASVSGTNTGDITLTGQTYLTLTGQQITVGSVDLSGSNATGILAAARFPALTGDVTTSAGSLTTTIANSAVTNAKMANMNNNTVKGNVSGSAAAPTDLTTTQLTTLVNTFTTLLSGAVPAPGIVAGKVLSDNGTWVINGTGATNTNVGSGYRLAIPSTNQIKTVFGNFLIIDSTSNTNALTITVDTSKIAIKGADSIFVRNVGASGLGQLWVSSVVPDTIYSKKLVAGANITLTQNADSSITITSAGGGGGGITFIGAFDSQPKSTNGAVISSDTLYMQSADATHPGLVNTVSQTFAGAKTFTSAITISTLTTNGGVFFGNGSGLFLQSNAGTIHQLLHGGTAPGSPPSFSGLDLTADVINILPVANGGTGTSSPALVAGTGISITGSFPNQTINNTTLGTVTSVNVSGASTGLTFTGGPITVSGTITLGGTLVPAFGGTGLSSLTPYALIAGGSTATGTLQQVSGLGTANQVLTSNGPGQLPTWQNSPTGFTNPMTNIGDIIIGTTAGAAIRLGIGTAGQVLTVVSGSPAWVNGNFQGRDSVYSITTAGTYTVTSGYNIVQINMTALGTVNLTLPTTWHTSNNVLIAFTSNGTITNNNPMCTLNLTAGSGQTFSQASNPNGVTYNAGEILQYHLIGTVDQRMN